MAILEIKKFNEPILRKKSQELREVNGEIQKLIKDIRETMERLQGIGLAAPQIGVLKRIIVIRASDRGPSSVTSLVNPRIIKMSKEKEISEEGCLSFPEIFLKIKRAKRIEIKGLNEQGNKIRIKAEGLLARVFQHEVDHLDGILFFNRLGFFQRIKFKLRHPLIKFHFFDPIF